MSEAAERSKKAAKKGAKIVKLEKTDKAKKENLRPLSAIDPEEFIFALDIGTRTVVGVVGVQEGKRFRVLATETIEHKSRAMLDGQIHDIEQVASVVKEAKDKIEVRLGITLKRTAIAAAGRVLRTCRVRVDRELDPYKEIDRELVNSLEVEGIQQAQMTLDEEPGAPEGIQFYCVGYSVINYYLNNYVISRPEGHKGKTVGADVLATFLPHIVVDSLYTVMNRVGLEVCSLTLEPIAAINVAIPQDLRLLNLALVDIGAGTSDIALTKDGSVVAYAMAPIAGDEITEKLSQQYLLDFNTADKVKISLSTGKEAISFTDILKIKRTIGQEEALEVIKPAVEELAAVIAEKMLEFNGKAPNAVFLIGGGSQIPGLAELIAQHLKLPVERVAVRGRDVIQNIRFNDKRLSGPESITPYGIAITAQQQKGKDFLIVTVNGSKVKLFNSKRLTVADTFILLGYNPGQLFGRSGRSISFTLNGEQQFIRGEHGRTAEITVNGKAASLDTGIRVGDDIRITPAEDGKNAEIRLSDIADTNANRVLVNGEKQGPDYAIADGDIIVLETPKQESASKQESVPKQESVSKQESASKQESVSKQENALKQQKAGIPVQMRREQEPSGNKSAETAAGASGIPLTPSAPAGSVREANPRGTRITVNGNEVEMTDNKAQHIFVDIFNYIHFDLSRPQGNIILKLNGRQAAFTDSVKPGDNVEIYWEK